MQIQYQHNPKKWIGSFYFAEGMLFSCIIPMSIIMYKNFKVDNAIITLLSAVLSVPWILKPLVAPAFEMLSTKKRLVITLQLLLAALFFALAAGIQQPLDLMITLIILLMLACCAAIHDTTADGYYLQALNLQQRTNYMGLTNFFYHFARIPSTGLLVMLVGYITSTHNTFTAWRLCYSIIALTYLLLAIYHHFILIEVEKIKSIRLWRWQQLRQTSWQMLREFKQINYVSRLVILILIFNIAEAQLLRIVPLFLLDTPMQGGLGIATSNVGIILGIWGIIGIMIGALLASLCLKHYRLNQLLFHSTWILLICNSGYWLLSVVTIHSISLITLIIIITRLAFGFAISIFMAVIVHHFSKASLKMSVYSIGTSIMYLGMLLPGAASGWIEDQLGYPVFFLWIMLLQCGVVCYCLMFARKYQSAKAAF